jgi:hypothetical protein
VGRDEITAGKLDIGEKPQVATLQAAFDQGRRKAHAGAECSRAVYAFRGMQGAGRGNGIVPRHADPTEERR